MNLATPAKAHLFVKTTDAAKAKELAAGLQNETGRWLTLPGSDFVLTTEPPKVEQKNETLDLRFDIPEGAARLFLQRLAKVQPDSHPCAVSRIFLLLPLAFSIAAAAPRYDNLVDLKTVDPTILVELRYATAR